MRINWKQPLSGSLTLATFLSMILGIAAGFLFPQSFHWLSGFSKFIVTAIKNVAIPLLFFAILEGFLKAEFKVFGFFRMLGISAFNGGCAITIGLLISHLFRPGQYLPIVLPAGQDHAFQICLDCPGGLFELSKKYDFLSGTTLVIILALGVGTFLLMSRRLLAAPSFLAKIQTLNERVLSFLFIAIHWIVVFIPIAVFAAVYKIIASGNHDLVHGLFAYFLACLVGMILQIAIVYQSWVKLIAKRSLREFWRIALEPALYAFGVNSSLATLPITLKALDRLKVSEGSARLSACIGTNFNNDGILLYEVVAIFFLLQAYGIPLTVGQEVLVAVLCIIATIGVAGVPEAGIISLSLVLAAAGLPQEVLPLLLTVDWFLARARSTTNALGDITVAIALDVFSDRRRKTAA